MKFNALRSDFLFNKLSDKDLGVTKPSFYKDDLEYIKEVKLPKEKDLKFEDVNFLDVIKKRRSCRAYEEKHITKRELSYILKHTAGVEKTSGSAIFKPVPSGGACHPLDVYIAVINVLDMEKGIYYYHPERHSLQQIKKIEFIRDELVQACNNQSFVKNAGILYIIASNTYRTSWKYQEMSEKLILLDAGHLGDHLMLVGESIGLGSCPIASYDQELIDSLLDLDGEKELVNYIFPMGKRKI